MPSHGFKVPPVVADPGGEGHPRSDQDLDGVLTQTGCPFRAEVVVGPGLSFLRPKLVHVFPDPVDPLLSFTGNRHRDAFSAQGGNPFKPEGSRRSELGCGESDPLDAHVGAVALQTVEDPLDALKLGLGILSGEVVTPTDGQVDGLAEYPGEVLFTSSVRPALGAATGLGVRSRAVRVPLRCVVTAVRIALTSSPASWMAKRTRGSFSTTLPRASGIPRWLTNCHQPFELRER